jgi:hypothetical protein
MNPSRDIEKLFEHFGGNAGDYQEIGRENEARSARTRWPLLATLDFTQPAIPEVAQRRDVQLPHARGARSDAEADAAPTPINRGKPPLFARAHRRTIPPVGNVTLPAVPSGGSRFGELAAAEAEPEQAQTPSPAPAAIRPATPVAPAAPVSREAQAPLRGILGVPPAMPAAHATHAAPFATPSAAPKQPTVPSRPAPAAEPPASSSILGKLFASPGQPVVPQHRDATRPADPASLLSVFDRLRGSTARTDNPAAARAWPASRTPRS